jgi:hypothetical protein
MQCEPSRIVFRCGVFSPEYQELNVNLIRDAAVDAVKFVDQNP